jgi:hypothetical protein
VDAGCREKPYAEGAKVRVQVVEVRPQDDQSIVVRFSGIPGEGLARWAGSYAPAVGETCSVELDLHVGIEGSCAWRNDREQLELMYRDGKNILSGQLESVDPDGIGYFRLSPDCLIMVETSPGWDKEGTWISIQVSPANLSMTPQGG